MIVFWNNSFAQSPWSTGLLSFKYDYKLVFAFEEYFNGIDTTFSISYIFFPCQQRLENTGTHAHVWFCVHYMNWTNR